MNEFDDARRPADPPGEREPGERARDAEAPDGRHLAAPPSARYGPAGAPTDVRAGSPVARTIVLAGLAALVGAATIVIVGGILAQTSGLLAVAGLGGIVIGRILRGARGALTRALRATLPLVFAIDMIVLGNLGIWVYALGEGGVLGPIEYLAETFGPLVIAEVVVAAVAAYLAER